MDDPLAIIAAEQGFFTRAHADEAGYDDRAVTREVRSGRWHRIRRGYYIHGELWQLMSPEDRHRARTAAVLDSLGDAVAASHVSGALMHRLDVWGVPLARVHVTRLDGGPGRIEGDVVHHEGFVDHDEIVEVDGMQGLRPVRCAVETGLIASPESALVTFNSGLFLGIFGRLALEEQCAAMAHWPQMQHLHVPRWMATDKAESVGESRGLWFFWKHGIPRPVLQHEVRDRDGTLIGITDWAWPRAKRLGEFDGKVKYGRVLRPDKDPAEVVFEEKRREDRLREATDSRMIRLIWTDYDIPKVTAARVRHFLGLAA